MVITWKEESMIGISVIMPVYNTTTEYLKESVNSILSQTYQNIEFIIIDDGSTDDTQSYLQSIEDERIKLVRNSKKLGITKSLNIGLRMAKGKYTARMDSDDISLPLRLERQYAYMEKHPDVIACGTKVEYFGEQRGIHGSIIDNMERYRVKMLFVNPGPFHPTVMYRNDLLKRFNILYDEKLEYAQDYGMWKTIINYGKISVINETLLRYRIHKKQVTSEHRETQIRCDQAVQRELLLELLGSITDDEMNMHYYHSTGYYREASIGPNILRWYKRLISANREKRLYDQKELERYIEIIEKRLIGNLFRKDMPNAKKAWLIFRYLPFKSAFRITINTVSMKIKARCSYVGRRRNE